MNRKLMVMLVLCLFVTRSLAQSNATGKKIPEGAQVSNYRTVTKTQTYIDKYGDKKDSPPTKSDTIRKRILDIPEWKKEHQAIIDEFHNSDAWKKHYAGSVESLKILGDHPGPKEYGIWREVVSQSHAELESSEAYKIYDSKLKDFNKRLDKEYRRRLAEEYSDPR